MGLSPKGQDSGPSTDVHSPICTCSPSCGKFSRFVFIVKPYLAPQSNSFAVFLREQIPKEIMYHIVFRTTTTCRIRLIMADLDAATFRHAPYPPIDTLAFLGSIVSAFGSPGPGYSFELSYQCYQVLLSKLLSIWRIGDVMPIFPTASQVHAELCETAFVLLHQLNDPGYLPFLDNLRQFFTIT